MLRLRALLALLLTMIWCSAAWHVDLEAAGLMFDHEHHAHDHDRAHGPVGAHDDHDEVFARDVAKDQIRVVGGPLAWLALPILMLWLLPLRWPSVGALSARRRRRDADPPCARRWQFIWRCAPKSAAPPALA